MSSSQQPSHKEKEAAQLFLAEQKIVPTLEAILNDACRARPQDIHAFMARALESLALPPSIVKLEGSEVLGATGQGAVRARVHVQVLSRSSVQGVAEAPGGACVVTSATPAADGGEAWECRPVGQLQPIELFDAASTRLSRRGALIAASHVGGALSAAVAGLDPRAQQQVDERLWAADPTPRKTQLGGNAILAASLAVLQVGAALGPRTVEAHVRQALSLASPAAPPRPTLSLLSFARSGKVKLRGVHVCAPARMSVAESVAALLAVYQATKDVLSRKAPLGVPTTPTGAFVVAYDKLDPVFELLSEVAAAAGLAPSDLGIVLDCGGGGFWDEAKQKYDMIAAQARTRDETVNEYAELVRAHANVEALIDPFRAEDHAQWTALQSVLASACKVVAMDHAESHAGPCATSSGPMAGAVVVRLAQAGTVSRMAQLVEAARQGGLEPWVAASDSESGSDVLADLSVALGAARVLFGAPVRERAALFSRLVELSAKK